MTYLCGVVLSSAFLLNLSMEEKNKTHEGTHMFESPNRTNIYVGFHKCKKNDKNVQLPELTEFQ